jgi:hypothetical protein
MIILRQKQFNIAQEFYHSGGSRVMKKYAGRRGDGREPWPAD